MCGIFAYLSTEPLNDKNISNINNMSNTIRHRGPDANNTQLLYNNRIFYSFHRLKIVDLSDDAMQPNQYYTMTSMCNGEIYNYISLRRKYNLKLKSNCDAEVIAPLIYKLGIYKTCDVLDGVFAFVVYDESTNELYVGRDPLGVRSLFYGIDKNGHLIIASEMKAIPATFKTQQFPVGHYGKVVLQNNRWTMEHLVPYYHFEYPQLDLPSENDAIKKIRYYLDEAVTKRMMSNRPIGCLLSGGLDSSIITALVAKKCKINGSTLKTFSIGMPGSVDLKYAQVVADYLGTDHTSIEISPDEMFQNIIPNIFQLESYDTTTVRASTPMYILSKYIKQNTDITVIFSGEGSDEASGSYLYFHNAPNPQAFQDETVRLLKDLSYYDVLRCDKSTAGHGLEVRVPFLDKDFLNFYMGIDPAWKMPNGQIEKRLLREAFKDLLPDEITYRVKEAFSDGVSSNQLSWYQVIEQKIQEQNIEKYLEIETSINPPQFMEAKYFRVIYQKHFGKLRDDLIPYYWLPKWSDNIQNPSARLLNVYQNPANNKSLNKKNEESNKTKLELESSQDETKLELESSQDETKEELETSQVETKQELESSQDETKQELESSQDETKQEIEELENYNSDEDYDSKMPLKNIVSHLQDLKQSQESQSDADELEPVFDINNL